MLCAYFSLFFLSLCCFFLIRPPAEKIQRKKETKSEAWRERKRRNKKQKFNEISNCIIPRHFCFFISDKGKQQQGYHERKKNKEWAKEERKEGRTGGAAKKERK
eukprot:TRINITY_DN2160_c0_g2_i1.p1 TRINITY_DN2160_c0_g2~~TRINITY_DN2160_c0_g2_i1.p1  ORF type:complete len:104 (-),score=24.50 TRINITY_DN2160_c0_g2_i1:114-425(-)